MHILCISLQIIVIDGNVAVGKNDFGRKLAKDFDMRFYPSIGPDRVYINEDYGYDMRKMNDILPPSARV